MTKTLLIISAFIIFALFTGAMLCAMLVANRFETNEKSNDDMKKEDKPSKKKICSKCKTGKETYELDPHSETCPYISCLENGKCQFFRPLENPSKTRRSENKKEENSPTLKI